MGLLTVSFEGLKAAAQETSSFQLARDVQSITSEATVACLVCYPTGLAFYLQRELVLVTVDGSETTSNYIPLYLANLAVLRPRLSEQEIGEAILRAFRHHGKPYDFEFDFFTADKLVCTELVYRAYEGMLRFDLVRVMGRDTLPALELVRKYGRERGQPDQELDFVLFLGAEPASGGVNDATEDAFVASADRPSAFSH